MLDNKINNHKIMIKLKQVLNVLKYSSNINISLFVLVKIRGFIY